LVELRYDISILINAEFLPEKVLLHSISLPIAEQVIDKFKNIIKDPAKLMQPCPWPMS
jgi:hypothetical protein